MTKYRSREIVEAVQWFPGVKISGLNELREIEAAVFFETDEFGIGSALRFVYPGAYIVTKGVRHYVVERSVMETQYEDIGG